MTMEKTKSIHINETLHLKLKEIRFSLEKIGIEKSLNYICNISIRKGIDNTFEFIKNSEDTTNKEWTKCYMIKKNLLIH